jgi:DNA-binding MarR family transcriptional regulator
MYNPQKTLIINERSIQFRILKFIFNNGKKDSYFTSIYKNLNMHDSAVGSAISNLIESGLILQSGRDGRHIYYQLSEKGKSIIDCIIKIERRLHFKNLGEENGQDSDKHHKKCNNYKG